MTIPATQLIALDTNVLVDWIRQNPTGVYLRDTYQLQERIDRPIYSSVVEGELKGLAALWGWGEKKLEVLDDLLSELVRVDAGLPEIVTEYAILYAGAKAGGHSSGENDLWIAATAKAAGAVLLTCDGDFKWMHPAYLCVEHVVKPKV